MNAEIESIIQLKITFFVKIYLKDHRNYEIYGIFMCIKKMSSNTPQTFYQYLTIVFLLS